MWWAIAAFVGLLAWSLPRWGSPTALYIAGVGYVAVYLVTVLLFPWTSCWKCGGDSKVRDAGGKNWRYCQICGGSGNRRRLFARRER